MSIQKFITRKQLVDAFQLAYKDVQRYAFNKVGLPPKEEYISMFFFNHCCMELNKVDPVILQNLPPPKPIAKPDVYDKHPSEYLQKYFNNVLPFQVCQYSGLAENFSGGDYLVRVALEEDDPNGKGSQYTLLYILLQAKLNAGGIPQIVEKLSELQKLDEGLGNIPNFCPQLRQVSLTTSFLQGIAIKEGVKQIAGKNNKLSPLQTVAMGGYLILQEDYCYFVPVQDVEKVAAKYLGEIGPKSPLPSTDALNKLIMQETVLKFGKDVYGLDKVMDSAEKLVNEGSKSKGM